MSEFYTRRVVARLKLARVGFHPGQKNRSIANLDQTRTRLARVLRGSLGNHNDFKI